VHGQRWRAWPEGLKHRREIAAGAIDSYLEGEMAHEKALQFLFDRQWRALHERCRRHGVLMFGDLPIYVNMDSADVWADPEVFQLDEALNPRFEAGVPPDYFSASGQLWRNPVYDWDYLEATQFRWWVERLRTLLARFDVLRIDHFRGLAQYWAVAAGAEHARDGHWCDVPSTQFFDTVFAALKPLPLVAEDLGTITPDVIELRDRYGLPGMIVLQFAFGDDHHDNPYKPENHRENAVAYLGTHDNNTALGWLEGDLDDAARYRLGAHVAVQHGREGVEALIDLLLRSRAHTAIACAQDLLALPGSARMNTPGEEEGNWRWQLTPAQFEALPLAWLGERSRAAGR
jgi:4-alpha-glucanotransferase